MIASMTGFGRAEVTQNGITATVEVRSVNNRYLEVTARLPRHHSQRDREVKELVRSFLSRGSINVTVRIERKDDGIVLLKINESAAKAVYRLLNDLRKSVGVRQKVTIEHLLHFSEIFEPIDEDDASTEEWNVILEALKQAFEALNSMRIQEGQELANDLRKRILWIDETVTKIEQLSKERIPEERKNLQAKVAQLVSDPSIIDQNRLELEIALLAEKLDVTEECVRYHSHNKFFLEILNNGEAVGRKLNFLVQEMNREANTIGSKVCDATIAHLVVAMKEELEKIREQVQNLE
ncbi:MAG: YicC family protein [Bacteroidetes bacterium]|nr:YicC family protein [Bacteroidota bacterium]